MNTQGYDYMPRLLVLYACRHTVSIHYSSFNCNCCQLSKRLTVEGQVSEEGGQQVHDEHGQEGHVGNALHLSAGTAVRAREQGMFDLDTRAAFKNL